MRLKKLVVIGFKSFADKTTLYFDQGITCIVGPNGCGKSNISDAFRWVLGEQSAKSMRGSKMPDVIFSGANNRKPLNFAEVSLTLSDIQGVLPIDYEEVTLTRRLHRSGESEYFINDNLVRLKDLQNLFLDSGVGRNAFSIFEQGKLDQVISYTPLERRHIFEEAAGIVRFLQRKRESLKRLEQVDLNLSRARDIHQEVEKQIQILTVQAEKSLVYKENKNELEKLEKTNYLLRSQALNKRKRDLEEKQRQKQSEGIKIKEILKSKHEEIHKVKDSLQKNEVKLKVENEKLYQCRSSKEIHLMEVQTHQQSIQEAQAKEKKTQKDLEELSLSREFRLKAIDEILQKQKKIEEEYHDAESKLSHHHDRVKSKEKEVFQIRQDLQVKQQGHLKWLERENQLISEIKQLEVRLENNADRNKKISERKSQLLDDLNHIVKVIEDKKKSLQEVSASVDQHQQKLSKLETQLKEQNKVLELKSKEFDGFQRKLMESKARQRVLLKMRADLEGFSSGGKKLLQESQQPESPFYQVLRPLYEFFNTQGDTAQALAVVLRQYAQTLVVEKESDFSNVIAWAEENRLGDYSLICLELIEKLKKDGKRKIRKNAFLDLVEPGVLANHFLESVEQVKDHDAAIRLIGHGTESWCWSTEAETSCRLFFLSSMTFTM